MKKKKKLFRALSDHSNEQMDASLNALIKEISDKKKDKINIASKWAWEIVHTADEISQQIQPLFKDLDQKQISSVLEYVCANICREFKIEDMEISLKRYRERMKIVDSANEQLIKEGKRGKS